jgi:hypothetical protein
MTHPRVKPGTALCPDKGDTTLNRAKAILDTLRDLSPSDAGAVGCLVAAGAYGELQLRFTPYVTDAHVGEMLNHNIREGMLAVAAADLVFEGTGQELHEEPRHRADATAREAARKALHFTHCPDCRRAVATGPKS